MTVLPQWLQICFGCSTLLICVIGVAISLGVKKANLEEVQSKNKELAQRDNELAARDKELAESMDKLRISIDALALALAVSQQKDNDLDRRVTRIEDIVFKKVGSFK